MTVPSRLTSFPVVAEIPVQWGEMDAYGHVNSGVFFRYFEVARVEYLAQCGFLESYEVEQVGAILHSAECRYRRPVVFPDTVLVGARATDISEDRFTMAYLAVSLTSGEVVAEGRAVVVSFDYATRRKTRLPTQVRSRIRLIEQTAGELH